MLSSPRWAEAGNAPLSHLSWGKLSPRALSAVLQPLTPWISSGWDGVFGAKHGHTPQPAPPAHLGRRVCCLPPQSCAQDAVFHSFVHL